MAFKNGGDKYGPYNWRDKKVRYTIYIDAALRHLHSVLDGEDNASDSKLHHLSHAAACCLILLDAIETGNLIDDRPTKGPTAELIERFKKQNEVPLKEFYYPNGPYGGAAVRDVSGLSTVSEGYYTHDATARSGGTWTGPGSPTEGRTEASGAYPVPYYPHKEKAPGS